MAVRRQGTMGKGLGALIPELSDSTGLVEVPVESIQPNPRQPRTRMEPAALEELASSIREHGVIQPLIVQRMDDDSSGGTASYRLIAGERRWRAARQAGLAAVPVIIKDVDDQGLMELALVENIQREDLSPLEEAAAYRYLVDELKLTQDEVARRVGKARVTVANALRLLQAPLAVRQALGAGDITEGHARALIASGDGAARGDLLRRVVDQHLSVRQTEEMVRRSQQSTEFRHAAGQDDEIAAAERELERVLGTKVTIRRGRRGGTVTIHFFGDEELDGLLMRLSDGGDR